MDPVYPYKHEKHEGVFTFRYEEGDKTVTFEVGGGQHLSHMLNEIKLFLQASGYGFHANEDLEVVDNSYSDDVQRDWENADLDGWDEQEKEDWQAPGQQWQTNGWSGVGKEAPIEDWQTDGPTEFAFNGTKESDFWKSNNGRSDSLYGAVPPNTDPIVDESGLQMGTAGKKGK